jgi:hypothetical protein
MKDAYIKVNSMLLMMIIGVLVYSYLFPYLASKSLVIPSFCQGLPEKYCKSRGLSRAFAEIVRLRLNEARAINIYALPIFVFFVAQLVLRVVFSAFYIRTGNRSIVYVDGLCSAMYFLIVFVPLAPFA